MLKKIIGGIAKSIFDEFGMDTVVYFDSYIIRLNRETRITKGFLLSLYLCSWKFNLKIFKNA